EGLTTDLSRVSGSFVIARNTAFTYKGKSVDAVLTAGAPARIVCYPINMKERIDQIRTLLSDLESEASRVEQAGDFRALSGLELPDIICDVVDLLMPGL